MEGAASSLINDLQGAKLCYLQSDEASFLLTDFAETTTQAHFDGNVQKIVSTAAALMSVCFTGRFCKEGTFDARVFTIPDRTEVANYFIWRQKDWIRNSVQMLARSLYSHRELHGMGQPEMHDLIHAKGQNWAALEEKWKNGTLLVGRPSVPEAFEFTKDHERLMALIPVIP